MECLGPQCASMLLEWIKAQAAGLDGEPATPRDRPRQATLWTSAPYQEDAPAIRSEARAGRRARAPAIRRLSQV